MAYFTGFDGQTHELGVNSGYGPSYTSNSAFGTSNIVDWLGGSYGAKEQANRQSQLDYEQWLRNEYSAKQQRAFEEYMSNTQVQRTMADLKAAGLNPWLAVQSAGFGGAVPTEANPLDPLPEDA